MTGGGSGGPVTPLLAITDFLNKEHSGEFDFLWIGTKNGPEEKMVSDAKINFKSISSGKFRRYFSFKNFTDIFKILWGFCESIKILQQEKPALVMSAGGFVSVPVVYAAKIVGVPVLIHQQDVRPGLANRIMSLVADKITVTFKKSLNDYPNKSVWTSNPVRKEIKNICEKDYSYFKLDKKLPVVLILGGGTGALGINKLVKQSVAELGAFYQIFHQTGRGKDLKIKHLNYQGVEFLDSEEMAKIMFLADIIISRCGLGTLTELAYLKKASIIIPMPNSHQEDNAEFFKNGKAVKVLHQKNTSSKKFIGEIKNLLEDKEGKLKLQNNIGKIIDKNAEEKITEEILKLI